MPVVDVVLARVGARGEATAGREPEGKVGEAAAVVGFRVIVSRRLEPSTAGSAGARLALRDTLRIDGLNAFSGDLEDAKEMIDDALESGRATADGEGGWEDGWLSAAVCRI